ncbi:MAG: hypothetical protein BGO07_00290 [Alphaproteobacteria bacterium 40-19]|nr:MAG: hypothetical protein BGO07_00290 [Alphaproteobacteria bacterium 40-19]
MYLCKEDSAEPDWLNQLVEILKEPKKAQDIFKHTRNFRDFVMPQKLIDIVKTIKLLWITIH